MRFMIGADSQADYANLKTSIQEIFENAIKELAKYFTNTHTITGERILNLPSKDGKLQFPDYEISMKNVVSVCN